VIMWLNLFCLLMVLHFLCDYPLQGDFLSRAKNRAAPLPGVPWEQALMAHSAIHGGAVWLATGSPFLGTAEFLAHGLTDDAKCSGRLTYRQDQLIHALCKAVWAVIAIGFR
jgi:hypothetical protein